MTNPTDPIRGPWQAVLVDDDGYAVTAEQAFGPARPATEIVVVRGLAAPGPDGRVPHPSTDTRIWDDTLFCNEVALRDDMDLANRWAQAQAVAALLNLANGRTVDELLDDRHVIELGPEGWTLQHPLTCRMSGALFDCRFNRAAARLTRVAQLPAGRYEVIFSATSGHLKIVPPIGDDELVWIAVGRAGVDRHALADFQLSSVSRVTECGRSTRTGHVLRLADVARYETRPCSGCYPAVGDGA